MASTLISANRKRGTMAAAFFAAFLLNCFIFGISAIAQEAEPFSIDTSPLPAPTGYVNDFAGVLDAATKQQLEAKLKNLKETTSPSAEIAVAIVRTTGERPIFEYSLAVARGWKIGSKQDDNPSALLFVAIDDRKYFTHVSRDLEDELPDGIVGSIQRQYLVPEFRKGNYSKGISDTIDAYIARVEGKGLAAPTPTPGQRISGKSAIPVPFFCCAIGFIILLVMLMGRGRGGPSGRDRGRWGGGGFGSGGGGSVLPWIIGSAIGSGLGGGSSSSGSSDWGGSSGGWGGFGGGGDFGGGGAGGDW